MDLSDDYQAKENQKVESMKDNLSLPNDDGKGVAI